MYIFRVVCGEFAEKFGESGKVFPCFYSQLEPSLVITSLDLQEVKRTLQRSLLFLKFLINTIPWMLGMHM